jgi:hypothetical protein
VCACANLFDGLVYQRYYCTFLDYFDEPGALAVHEPSISRPSESIYPQQRGLRIALTLFGHLVGGVPVSIHTPPHKSSGMCQGFVE